MHARPWHNFIPGSIHFLCKRQLKSELKAEKEALPNFSIKENHPSNQQIYSRVLRSYIVSGFCFFGKDGALDSPAFSLKPVKKGKNG
jgi:hypothetical protein